jgi:hypothetical protein
MGKVGSTTIVRSLHALKNLDRPVYHSHLLNWPRIRETEAHRKKLFRTDRYSHLKRPWLNRFVRRQIDKGFKNGKWKIISLVRDPIARNVSTFFENLDISVVEANKFYRVSSDYYDFDPLTVSLETLGELIDIYFKRFRHDTPLTFFDTEFRGVLNFDVYDHPFQKSKGYDIYSGDDFDVMLIRLEDLNRVAGEAFASFLDIQNFELVSSNVGQLKIYAPLYGTFKQQVAFPKRYLDRFYDSKFMRHFYSQTEGERMRSAWKCQD